METFISQDLPGKKKKSTGSIHSQSSIRPLRGGRCFPSLDLATKGRKWKRNISGSFSEIYQKLKALFPLFLLPTISQDRYSLYSQWNMEKNLALNYLVSFQILSIYMIFNSKIKNLTQTLCFYCNKIILTHWMPHC